MQLNQFAFANPVTIAGVFTNSIPCLGKKMGLIVSPFNDPEEDPRTVRFNIQVSNDNENFAELSVFTRYDGDDYSMRPVDILTLSRPMALSVDVSRFGYVRLYLEAAENEEVTVTAEYEVV